MSKNDIEKLVKEIEAIVAEAIVVRAVIEEELERMRAESRTGISKMGLKFD